MYKGLLVHWQNGEDSSCNAAGPNLREATAAQLNVDGLKVKVLQFPKIQVSKN